jgi:hypothetical protein
MVDLVPAPSDLGLASPALGPWFGPSSGADPLPTLTAPQADLSVSLSLAPDQQWLAPANGLVSYFIASATRPAGLARLRAENGNPAFTDGQGVILFTLLPEVELRLHALARNIPAPNDATTPAEAPTRPRIRWLAYETSFPSVSTLGQMLESGFPADLSTDADRAAWLGLKLDGSLGNADKPATILKRPARDGIIVDNNTGGTITGKLWAFDYRGRPVDAGAVAAWWDYLASVPFDNLWASDDAAEQRTADRDAAHSLHIVSAHEGPLSAAHRARLNITDFTQVTGAQTLYSRSGTSPAVALTSAPDPDDAPIPRLAILPHGVYDDPATNGVNLLAQWADGDWDAKLARDFARLGLVDVEQHLVGLDRSNPAQASERMRIQARRNSAAAPYFTRIDAGTEEIMTILRDGGASMVMAPVMDTDWSALDAPALAAGTPPEQLEFEVRALRGEGIDSGGSVSDQRVVVILQSTDHALPPGAWVRVWPHGLDTETGQRFPKDGGGGLVDAGGRAVVVVPLPDGSATPEVPMSFDAMVVTNESARFYPEQRFERPAVVSGAAVDLPAPPGLPSGFTPFICEAGTALARGGAAYGGGQTLVAIPDDPSAEEYALVNLATLDAGDYDADTLRQAVGGGDTLIVTKPAFGATPEGDITSSAPNGASLVYRDRNGLTDTVTEAGRPVPTMERRELAGVDPGNARGLVGGAPGYSSMHEVPPSQLGHIGMPAAPDTHGVAAALAGPATVPLTELMRERASTNLLEFVQAAQIAPTEPADPGGPSKWSAVLETMTRGIAGDAAMRSFAAAGFTPGQAWLDLKSDIESATGQDLDAVIDSATFNDDDLARAIDRMLVKTRDGAQQVAVSVQAAIDRAEDFIFIETPSLDALSAASGAVTLVNKITTRLGTRPGLVVAIACPEMFLPHQPKMLEDVRKKAISGALKALKDAAPERVVLFTPTAGSGRRLHMATTTVIIDDAYALTGAAHLWRRGLTFDSSLAVAGFDETLVDGRPASVRTLRRALVAERLALPPELAPDDAQDLVFALKRTIAAGGQDRVKPGVFPARTDDTGIPTQDAWNPDGGAGGVTNWFLFFTDLSADVKDEISNAVR